MQQKLKQMKKHRKLWIIIVIIVVIAILAGMMVSNFRKRSEQMAAFLNQTETASVERRTLVSSVSATGVICSSESKDVKANLNGVEVKTVAVEVGDYVKSGDILCEFDSVDLQEDLEDAKTSLNNAVAKSNIDVANAQRSLSEAQENRDIQNARNEQSVTNAWNDYAEVADRVSKLNDELNALKKSQEDIQKSITAKENEIEEARQPVSGNDAATGDIKIDDLNNQLKKLQDDLIAVQASIAAKEGEIAKEEPTKDSLWSAYVKTAEAKEDGIRNNDSKVLSSESALSTSQLNASTTGNTNKQQIETYEEQIAACTVTAPIDGVVTAVNLEVGDNYNGSAILTIEDDSSFIVEAEIDEYDIGKIKEGQEVVIKTNATGDEELSGTVIHISPRATSTGTAGMSSQSGSVTYTVKISVDTPHEMLRMDMTAKLSIVLEKKADVLTVPYAAVCEDEEGNFYVEVVNSAEPLGNRSASETGPQTTRVYVTKGIESDYYVEVSGEGIEEGMEVVVPQNDSMLMDIQSRMREMGAMGGF